MTLILADVGGTNVRFACVADGSASPAQIQRFQNDGYASFDAALRAYLEQIGRHKPSALSVAVAGPVTDRKARLTNRGWEFSTEALARDYGLDRVYLLNDLSALGYALDSLDADGLATVLQPEEPSNGGDQRLVVGVGTGFNVSPVLRLAGASVCLRAEAGLGSLPSRVSRLLEEYLGGPAGWVRCAEDAVRGPGLAELHAAATRQPKIDARDVIAAANAGDVAAVASVKVYARMLGELVLDLRLLYMPLGGIFLAGSVVRGLLDSPARQTFVDTLRAPASVKSTLTPVPVSLITKDEAALMGCLAFARALG